MEFAIFPAILEDPLEDSFRAADLIVPNEIRNKKETSRREQLH